MRIGPDRCWTCGDDYGHTPECPDGQRQDKEFADRKIEDSISKRDLLHRIEELERRLESK